MKTFQATCVGFHLSSIETDHEIRDTPDVDVIVDFVTSDKRLRAPAFEVTAFASSESKFEESRGFGAHHVASSRDTLAIKKLAGTIDLLIVTVNVKSRLVFASSAGVPESAGESIDLGFPADSGRTTDFLGSGR